MTAPSDPRQPDTSATAVADRLGRGILFATLFVVVVQVLAIGPEEAVQRLADGIRAIMPG